MELTANLFQFFCVQGIDNRIIILYNYGEYSFPNTREDAMTKKKAKKPAKRGRGRPRQDGVIISAVGEHSQLDDLDSICLAIRRANPGYRIRRSELMRAIFEAVLPTLKKGNWSGVGDHEALVSALESNLG